MADSRRFEDKTVVVIGGNSGIGLAAAKAFACEGGRVLISGRNPCTLTAAIREIGHGASGKCSDISDLNQIRLLFSDIGSQFGRIDVLFVNAGVLSVLSIESVTEADWDRLLSVNLKGVFFTVQAALPLMSIGSSIVMTGSTAASIGVPIAPVYAMTKAGLRSLGRSLAAAFADRGIRVNVVSPGYTETAIYRRAQGLNSEQWSALEREMLTHVPLNRAGRPEEVAEAVLFLSSDAAAFITGVELLVSGGAVSV